jgi:hypothetical protein
MAQLERFHVFNLLLTQCIVSVYIAQIGPKNGDLFMKVETPNH